MATGRLPDLVAQDPSGFLSELFDILADLKLAAAQHPTEIDSDDLPEASASLVGVTYIVTHAATDTSVEMCVPNKAHTGYEWIALGATVSE